ncbi:MAG TPA: hypothetical protein VHD91_03585, partial [Gaiellaceae bacterium]|nr:hypothetical protein [Gaiellaceae bacterium]
MGTPSDFRRSLAERTAAVYAQEPGVVAVLFGGSAALGHADGFSDLELAVVWEAQPSDDARRRLVEAAGGDLVRLYEREPGEPAWADAWQLGRRDGELSTGVEMDMHHFVRADVDAIVETVAAGDPELGAQSFVAALVRGTALHGAELVAGWREAATPYPEALRLAMVRRYGQVEGLWRIEAFAARG